MPEDIIRNKECSERRMGWMPQTNKKWEVVSPLSNPGLGEVTDGQPLKYWSSLKVLSAWSPNVLTL